MMRAVLVILNIATVTSKRGEETLDKNSGWVWVDKGSIENNKDDFVCCISLTFN